MNEAKWKIHSLSSEYKKAIKSAKTIINRAFDLFDNWVISYSGGKDSTAMLHLIHKINPSVKIMTQIDDCDWPEKLPYIKSISDLLDVEVNYIAPDINIWDEAIKYNLGYTDVCSKGHNLTKYGFILPLEQKRKELECDGVFMGLRKQESKAREKNYMVRSHTYKTKQGIHYCTPIIHFSAIDTFAYLVNNNIPINPCYLKNKFFEPENIRLSWALPSKHGARFGENEHVRHYYPDLFLKYRNNNLL